MIYFTRGFLIAQAVSLSLRLSTAGGDFDLMHISTIQSIGQSSFEQYSSMLTNRMISTDTTIEQAQIIKMAPFADTSYQV